MHVRVVGGLALLWGVAAAYGYLAALGADGPLPRAPFWGEIMRGWGVWAGLIGAGLILFLCRLSLPVLAISLAGYMGDLFWRLFGNGAGFPSDRGALSFGFAIASLAISMALLDYALSLNRGGHFENAS
jgi:hypothetical protein